MADHAATTDVEHVLTDDQARALIEGGATFRDLVRHRWPDLDDEGVDWVLWERTAFPLISGVHDVIDAVYALPERPWADADGTPR